MCPVVECIMWSETRLPTCRSALGPSSAPLELRVERVAEAVADEVDGEHRGQDGKAGEGDHPPGAQDEFARIGERRAPFRSGRLRAEPEEAERRCAEDGIRKGEGALHDQRGE